MLIYILTSNYYILLCKNSHYNVTKSLYITSAFLSNPKMIHSQRMLARNRALFGEGNFSKPEKGGKILAVKFGLQI